MMYPEKYINKMMASLNCIFLGITAFSDSFTLKELTEEQICNDSELLVPIFHFRDYFQDQGAVNKSLIFVQVPVTGPSQQGVSQVTLLEPNEIFENFLKSEHGQFLNKFIEKNDALPSYDSGMSSLKTSVPATSSGDRPSLLLHNLPGDDHKPITRVSEVQSAIAKAKTKNNILIFLGTSGCGKTRTCYELLCENWGLYFVASKQGNGGSSDIERISSAFNERKTQDFEKNREIAVGIVRCAILARLLILRYCMKNESFNKQRWLLIQVCQNIFGKIYNYDDDIFRVLMLKLIACPPLSVTTLISEIYTKFDKETFIIVLDEIQVLETVDKGKFRSRTNEHEERSLLSPIVQAMKEPASSVSDNRCFIPCGTGLGILSLEEVLNTGILKPETDILKFTEFGEWQNIDDVKNYISKLVELTDHDYNDLYYRFRGRFRPIVTCVEDIIMGKSVNNVVDGNWNLLTKHETSKQSLYKQLSGIIERERPNHVKKINVLNLYKKVALVYYYSGSPFLFTNIDQMSIVESGFGRLRFVNPPTKSDLKKICDDDNMLEISSVDAESMFPAYAGENSLVAYVDEPFAIVALSNFFKNNGELPDEILEIMSIASNPSACGTLWQTYIPKEFEQMFNGEVNVSMMPIFSEIAKKYDLPAFCIGSPKLVKSSKQSMPLTKNATTSGYTLNEFFTESSDERPAFFIPDDRCGPDLIFFVKFEEVEVPVFVQIKLRYSIKTIAGALSTIEPNLFYKNKNGVMHQEESNKPIIEKIKKRCENGFIGILVAYPADVRQESFVTNGPNGRYELRASQDKLIGIIDQENASTVFHKDHLRFLDVLKNTMKRKKTDEEEKTGEGSKSKKKQKRAKK
ncbi:unnamed protein product [Rhizophagus irregularis]|nr:unnamed protein product [Rhizophagus irregularis]